MIKGWCRVGAELVQVGAIYFIYLFIYLSIYLSLFSIYLLSPFFFLSINLSLFFIGFTLLFGV